MEHKNHKDSHEEESHGESESITIRRISVHEQFAEEMKKNGIESEPLSLGSHWIESEQTYYSHNFSFPSRFVTNKGVVRILGKNIDFVQILQRN